MKNVVKVAMIMAFAALFAACGYKSVITPIEGSDLSTYTAKTKTEKVVMGVINRAGERIVPAAYDAITLQNGCLVAQYEAVDRQFYNLFLLDGKKAIDENVQLCEWNTDHFRLWNSKGEFLYYPETAQAFGPYKASVFWDGFIFFQTDKGTGIATKSGNIMQEQVAIFFIKDKKTDAYFFALPDGKKATLFDATGKEVKKLAPWGWTQLQKRLETELLLNGTVHKGTVPNIKAF